MEIEERIEVKEKTVWNFLKREGLTESGRIPVHRFSSDEEAAIIAEYENGRSKKSIATEYGIGEGVIGRILLENGVNPDLRYVRGADHPKWNGGRIVDSNGFIKIKITDEIRKFIPKEYANGYIQEHRLVMAQHLGRSLESYEQVHHINGDRGDNRLENLQIRQGDHGPGYILECRQCGSHDLNAVKIT
jgi:hypothetical protein